MNRIEMIPPNFPRRRPIRAAIQSIRQDLISRWNRFFSIHILDLLPTYINFGYFLLLCPFRFVKRSTSNRVEWGSNLLEIYESRIQKIFCGVAHALVLCQYTVELRFLPFANVNSKTHPATYLSLATGIAILLYKAVAIWVMWSKGTEIEKIVTFVQKKASLAIFQYRQKGITKLAMCVLLIVNVTIPVLYLVYGIPKAETGLDILCSYIGFGRFIFFRSNTSLPVFNLSEADGVDILTGFIAVFMILFRQLIAYYTDALLLMICLTHWIPAKGYKSLIQTELDSDGIELELRGARGNTSILYNYSCLRTLSSLIGSAFGSTFLIYMIATILYNSTYLNMTFIGNYWIFQIRSFYFFSSLVGILLISGDIGVQVDSMRDWIDFATNEENGTPIISNSEALVLLEQINSNRIGISGHIFVLNYGTVFDIIATIVTYFVITATQTEPETSSLHRY